MPYLNVTDSPKMLRETLCAAQAALGQQQLGDRRREHIARLGRLINECDRHRPLGFDGKHGARHTPTCGCEDRCADIPDAPEPGRYTPAVGERVRNGRKVPLHLYLHDADDPVGWPIGVIYHSPELARFVAEAVSHRLRATGWRWEYGVEMVWPDGQRQIDLRDDREDAEAVLAAQAEIPGNEVSSRLVRRLVTFGPVEEVNDGG